MANSKILFFFLFTFILFTLNGCSENNITKKNDDYVEYIDSKDIVANIPKSDLNQIEKDSIIWMREEEKLARDVYQYFNTKWDMNIFKNISQSEQIHMDLLKTIIDRYSVTDPVKDDKAGVFDNPEFTKLYNELTKKGEESLVNALTVGTNIEDLDIRDLEKYMSQIDNADIALVYDHLIKGSENHLRAFVKQLSRQNEIYIPQYILPERFESIVKSDSVKGNNRHLEDRRDSGRRGARE